jgi:hypothetical protein
MFIALKSLKALKPGEKNRPVHKVGLL